MPLYHDDILCMRNIAICDFPYDHHALTFNEGRGEGMIRGRIVFIFFLVWGLMALESVGAEKGHIAFRLDQR